tara:strand:- start:787 stop:4785 length:3999 start_codon:yes stop_codon:yes gene_type:complete
MSDSINNKAKDYYDNDNTGGSLNSNLKDFLKQQGAEGNSLNTLWRNYAYGEGGNSLNTRLGKLWGTSGSLVSRWKEVLGLTWDDLKLFFNARRNDPELLLSGATSFDGTNDYIDSNSTFQSTFRDSFTISMWIKLDDGRPSSYEILFGSQNADSTDVVLASIQTSGDIDFVYEANNNRATSRTNNPVFIDGQEGWHYLTFIANNSTDQLYIYKNGVVLALEAGARSGDASGVTFGDYTTTTNLWLGCRNENGSVNAPVSANIANIGIWNRALSLSEIESIYWKGQYADLKNTELTNLVSWYNLSADANDSTGTNNGTNNGATFLTDAYSASSPFLPRIQDKATPKGAVALASGSSSFDGSDDYIDLGSDTSVDNVFTGGGTVLGWFKPDSIGETEGRLLDKRTNGTGWTLHLRDESSNTCKLKLFRNYSTTNGAYETTNRDIVYNQWNHVAVVYDTSGAGSSYRPTIYINGSASALTVTDSAGSVSSDASNSLLIGNTGDATRSFDGSIANVAIYSDAKTQSQIQDIMFSSYSTLTSALKTNLVSWYDLGSTGLSSNKYNSTSGWTAYGNNTIQVNGLDFDITYVNNGNGIFGRYNNNILTSNVLAGAKYEVSFDAFYTGGSAPIVRYYTDAYTTIATLTTESTNYKYIHTPVDSTNDFINFKTNSGNVVSVKNFSFKEIQATDSQGDNEGSIYGATTNTGYTSSPSGVADPLNYGEVYGGNAVSFDGSNDYISVPQTNFGANTGTLSFWCYGTNLAGNGDRYIIGQQDEDNRLYARFNDADDNWYLGLSETFNINTSISFEEDKWLNAVIVYNSGSYVFYINGVAKNSGSYTNGSGIVDSNGWKIGSYTDGSSPWNGSIANVQIFNTILTQDQVRELYTKPELTLPTGIASSALKLDMPMQEGSGTAILDGSGNQNHGTGSGITWANGQEYGFQHPLVRSNNPMVFDGSNDHVAIGAVGNLGTSTISMWVKRTNTSSFDYLFDARGSSGVGFAYGENGSTTLTKSSGTIYINGSASSTIPTNEWCFIVISGITLNIGTNLKIGIGYVDINSNENLGHPFVGMINDVAIWDSALTATEVTALYNSGLPLLPTADSGNYASAADLVGYWRNDGVTTWTDRSTNSNNGTVSGSPASIIVPEGLNEGRDSQGYYLTNTDSISSGIRLKGAEYISVQDSESLDLGTSDFTLECWLKTTSQGYLRIMDKRDASSGFTLNVNTSEKINLELNDGSGNSGFSGNTAVNDGNWHHVVVSADRSANAKFYLNGVLDDTDDISAKNGSLNSVSTLFIGADAPNGDSLFFNGSIDEVRIYKGKALSATEVLKNYNNGKSAHSN